MGASCSDCSISRDGELTANTMRNRDQYFHTRDDSESEEGFSFDETTTEDSSRKRSLQSESMKARVDSDHDYYTVLSQSGSPTAKAVPISRRTLEHGDLLKGGARESFAEQKSEMVSGLDDAPGVIRLDSTDLRTAVQFHRSELHSSQFVIWQSSALTMAGQRDGCDKTNQDSYIRLDGFGPNGMLQIYGVADGHGPYGHLVSEYVVRRLPEIILASETDKLVNHTKQALRDAVQQLAAEMLPSKLDCESPELSTECKLDTRYSGSTLSVILRLGDSLFSVNIGDSRCCLARMPHGSRFGPSSSGRGKVRLFAVPLTRDHDPNVSEERSRLESFGASVEFDEDSNSFRVSMVVDRPVSPSSLSEDSPSKAAEILSESTKQVRMSWSVSRSLGDSIGKAYGITDECDIGEHQISEDDLFILCGSDGIWHMIESDKAISTISTRMVRNKSCVQMTDVDTSTKKLVNEVSLAWKEEYDGYMDDITLVLARLGPRREM